MSTATSGIGTAEDLVVRDADVLVTMTGEEIPGGWVAIRDGLVSRLGPPGTEPPATEVVSAKGSLVTPGLINTHHHIYQNLTRALAPIVNVDFWQWLTTLYDIWARIDEEAVYVSASRRAHRAGSRRLHDDDRPHVRASPPAPHRC